MGICHDRSRVGDPSSVRIHMRGSNPAVNSTTNTLQDSAEAHR
jgi:hypothetical protein